MSGRQNLIGVMELKLLERLLDFLLFTFIDLLCGGVAEWLKAAVLKTVERKFRGFESYLLRHLYFTRPHLVSYPTPINRRGVRAVEGARLESVCTLTGTEGSNPSLSAIWTQALWFG